MARSNKLFVMIAIFLVGMLVLALLAIGGVVIFGSINRAQQAARPTATTTLIARAPTPTQTRTPTITPLATITPLPTPTNTPVVQATPTGVPGAQNAGVMSGQGEVPTPTPTSTPMPPGESSTPDTGIGGLEAVLIAVGLVGVVLIARRLRRSS
jgi:hypothetical protein